MQATIGATISIEVNYDPDLFVGMTIYDDSGVSPVQLGDNVLMTNVVDTLYRAKFVVPGTGPFIIRKAVYLDIDMTMLSPDYSRSSEAIEGVQSLSQVIAQSASAIPVVVPSNLVSAKLLSNPPISAIVSTEEVL